LNYKPVQLALLSAAAPELHSTFLLKQKWMAIIQPKSLQEASLELAPILSQSMAPLPAGIMVAPVSSTPPKHLHSQAFEKHIININV